MAKIYSRTQHEIEPSCVLPVFFWHVKDFDAARDGDAEGLKKSPNGHTMGNDALTNGPMSSQSPPNLKICIIVCPSRVKIG